LHGAVPTGQPEPPPVPAEPPDDPALPPVLFVIPGERRPVGAGLVMQLAASKTSRASAINPPANETL
jgi:hypothetical protein